MRNQITSAAIGLALLSNPDIMADARKQLIGADEQRLATRGGPNTPIVKSETCKDYCFFGKDDTYPDEDRKVYWCLAFEEPIIKFGWQYKQDANTSKESTPIKHLRFDLIYYLQNKFQLTSTMDIFRLYYN